MRDKYSSLKNRIAKLENKLCVLESKQVGDLYHVCTLSAYLDYILPEDKLSASGKYMNWLYGQNMYVSFTRDKGFVVATNAVDDSDILVQLVVDGDKLSENYKIGPYNDFAYDQDGNPINDSNLIRYREKEEVVNGPIKNISKYIKHVYIDSKDVSEESLADLEDLVELNSNAVYYKFIRNKNSALSNFIKLSGLSNGDSVSDALIVFKEYYYTVENSLFSGDVNTIEKAMVALEDDSDYTKLNSPHGDKGLLLNYYCDNDSNKEIVKTLLLYGADPSVQNKDGTIALSTAAINNCKDIAKLLVEFGSEYTDTVSDIGYTPLMYACKNNSVDVAKYLIQIGADVDVVGNDGKKAFNLTKNGELKKLLYTYSSR